MTTEIKSKIELADALAKRVQEYLGGKRPADPFLNCDQEVWDMAEAVLTAGLLCECNHVESAHAMEDADCVGDPPRYVPDPRPCLVAGCDCLNYWPY